MSNEDTMLKSALAVATEALKKEREINGILREKLQAAEKQSVADKETIRKLQLVIDQDESCSTLLE